MTVVPEKPEDIGGAAEHDQSAKPWPVVGRGMVNYGNVYAGTSHNVQGDRYLEFRESGVRWPGLLVVLAGLVLAAYAFVGWTSILVRFLRRPEPGLAEITGPTLPSGAPVGLVYGVASVVGVALILIGIAMRRRNYGTGWQVVCLALLIAVVVTLVVVALGGAPFSVLLPRFS